MSSPPRKASPLRLHTIVIPLLFAGAAWAVLAFLGVHRRPLQIAVGLTFFAVRHVLLRDRRGGMDDLRQLSVDLEDPAVVDAVERARDSIWHLAHLHKEKAGHCMVKVRDHRSSRGIYTWADVLSVPSDDRFRIRFHDDRDRVDTTCEIERGELVDWQVALADGRTTGGFTLEAALEVYERERGKVHPSKAAFVAGLVAAEDVVV